MPEHFTKNTVEASVWCAKCGKATPHRIDDGRRGPCLICLAALTAKANEPGKPPAQGDLF